MIADIVSQADNVLPQYGLAGLVIISLVLTIVKIYKDLTNERNRNDAIQGQRLIDVKETQDKLTGPLAQQAKLTEQIYDILLNSRRK